MNYQLAYHMLVVLGTYSSDEHEVVIHAPRFPPHPYPDSHGEDDPTQHEQYDCAVQQRHSISGHFDSRHVPCAM